MDIQVQELIDKIKKDGVESATEDAARIKAAAEAEARQIVEAAKKEAVQIGEKARQDAERSEKAGNAALAQASRNLLLVFKTEVQALLDSIISKETGEAYSEDTLKKAIPEVLAAWGPKDQGSLDVLLSEASLGKLQSFFETKLAKELKKGTLLKSDPGLAAGFRISQQDGSAYYDFSAESVAQMFCAYLNPKLAEIMKAAARA